MTDKELETKIEYYDNGNIKRAYSVDKNRNKQGPFELYYESGQLKVKCTYKDGKLDGLDERYDEKGQLLRKCTYKDGKEDGPYELYWDNGQLWVKCTYKNGEYDGPYERYNENGRLDLKCTYKDGKLDGPYEKYYANGQLAVKRTYKDGKLDGPYEEYYTNGQLNEKGVYRMGERLYGKEAEEYLKEWNEKHNSKEARKGLNARLRQMSKKMPATAGRQSAKRAEVAKFRENHPDKHAGRVIEKKNWLQKLFRGGR